MRRDFGKNLSVNLFIFLMKPPQLKPSSSLAPRRTWRTSSAVSAMESASSGAFSVVGIGASAGGLEAVTHLLKALPPDFGMAVVLIQHLDPTHESALSILLSRVTLMPVVEARHRLKVKPGHVYIIPPNKKMGISRGVLRVMARDADHRLPSAVDFFFHELAVDFGARAIGIILSGTGMDGTRGIQEIKSAGGVTFTQDESSAKYSGMPMARLKSRLWPI